ncbi:MAG: hypothetical protein BWY91_01916 [bacterium ADurb.BinA028]|nr:MAG: hypothetical protein BWY91_01916 [bacterium ADurb.BinA028]
MTPGTAVPIAFWRVSVALRATCEVICTPRPSISIMMTGVKAAAWNQRNAFQNQDRPPSQTRPAAAIGLVAARTSRAAPRVSMTSRCPKAAKMRKKPITPRTVAMVPSVMSAVENPVQGCQASIALTCSRASIRARVRPPAAATTATQ